MGANLKYISPSLMYQSDNLGIDHASTLPQVTPEGGHRCICTPFNDKPF